MRRSSPCSRVGSPGGEADAAGLPLGLGLSASGPPSRYALTQFFRGVVEAMPKPSMASALVIPPSTTVRAAASLVSYEYLAYLRPTAIIPSS